MSRKESIADVRVFDVVRTSALIYRLGEANKKRYASLRAAKPKDDENDEEEIPDLDNLFDDNDKTQVNDEEPIYDDNFELIKKVTSPTKRVLIEELPDKQPDSTEPVEYRCDLCTFKTDKKNGVAIHKGSVHKDKPQQTP